MKKEDTFSFIDLVTSSKDFIKYGKKKISNLVKSESNPKPTQKKENVVQSNISTFNELSLESTDEMVLLEKKVSKCMLCALCKSRTKTVFGSGDNKSILYIVGEGPGRDEDLQGKPFVGRGGQLLTKMLEAIAIQRENIYITNIVKCRPPENRNPEPDEIMRCTPYLDKQIAYGAPRFILTLGRFSTGYFLNDFKSSLSDLRKQTHNVHNATLIATFHPAAVLRSPNRWKPLVWEDLKILAHLLIKENFYNEEQLTVLKKNKVI